MDISGAIAIAAAGELDAWLREHGAVEREVVVAIVKRSTGRSTVGLLELQEVTLCHGWVDTRTQRLDAERYAIRFVPRRPRSSWGPKNRAMARRLLAEGRLTERAIATLPEDL
jgi:uncharacterized protein YdeI (YjbR/CyaY-like superfamily)